MKRPDRRSALSRCVHVDADVLPGGEAFKHPFERIFPANTALFHSTIRLARKLTHALVDLYKTGVDRVRRTQGPADVPGPDIGGKPVVAIIGKPDHFGFIGPRNCANDGAENFFPRKPPIVRYAGEDSRNGKVAFRQRPLSRRQATNDNASALSDAILDIRTDPIELAFVDQ